MLAIGIWKTKGDDLGFYSIYFYWKIAKGRDLIIRVYDCFGAYWVCYVKFFEVTKATGFGEVSSLFFLKFNFSAKGGIFLIFLVFFILIDFRGLFAPVC